MAAKSSAISICILCGYCWAIQALITPVTDYGFPHYRYFHFFITHCGIIMTAFYFTWVKRGYRPTLKGIGQTMLILNILLPIILYLNHITGGNYMFLAEKPPSGSILDLLGPYPWYLLSLEIVATTMFLTLLLLFK
uniref:TMEM164-related integral membrane acyltransferase n=1 Tax=Paracerasibacillus soli TaxID=480284 RepID=UPI00387E0979